jgi:hypothetical protein
VYRLAQMTFERRFGRAKIQRAKIQREGGAMAETGPNDVIARCGNFYRGDDDLFAHCFVRRSGQSVLLFQGLQTVTLRLFDPDEGNTGTWPSCLSSRSRADGPKRATRATTSKPILKDPTRTRSRSTECSPGDPRRPGEYYVAPADSEVGEVFNDIAKID